MFLGILLSALLTFSNLFLSLTEATHADCGDYDHECIDVNCDVCTDCGDQDVCLNSENHVASAVVGSSCSSSVGGHKTLQAACTHQYRQTTVKEATCTQAGQKAYVCTKCGTWQPGAPVTTIKALGHNMQRVVTKKETCGTDGTYVTKCTRCGAGSSSGNGTIPKTNNHKWTVTGTTNPTCTVNGKKNYKCSVCGQTKSETLAKLGHNMQKVTTKQPTCGATGTYITKCSRCGTGDPNGNGSIPATGNHTYNITAATCTTARKCNTCGYVVQNALGHNMQRVTTKQPTCGATGTYVTKCSRCGAGDPNGNGSIPATGNHTYNIAAATCTTARKCNTCGYVVQNALGHNMQRVTTKQPTCGATGTYVTKCSRCGAGDPNGNGSIPATGNHAYNVSAATCTIAKKCNTCGYVAQQALGHYYQLEVTKQPTCGEQGIYVQKCAICHAVLPESEGYIPAVGNHNWVLTSTVPVTCTTDGKKIYTCSGCGQTMYETIEKLNHDYHVVKIHDATCGDQGVYATQCSHCEHIVENSIGYIPPTGNHDWVLSSSTEATCTEDGVKTYNCSVCGQVYIETIPKSGHDWGIPNIDKYPTLYESGQSTYTCRRCSCTETRETLINIKATYVAEGNESRVENYSIGTQKLLNWRPVAPEGKRFVGWSVVSDQEVFTSKNTIGEVLGDITLELENSLRLDAVWCDSDYIPNYLEESIVVYSDIQRLHIFYMTKEDILATTKYFPDYTVGQMLEKYWDILPTEGMRRCMYYHDMDSSIFDLMFTELRAFLANSDPENHRGLIVRVSDMPLDYSFEYCDSNWVALPTYGFAGPYVVSSFMHEAVSEMNPTIVLEDITNFEGNYGVRQGYFENSVAFLESMVDNKTLEGLDINEMSLAEIILDLLTGGYETAVTGAEVAISLDDIGRSDFDEYIKEGICGPSAAITLRMYLRGIRYVSEDMAVREMKEYFENTDNIFVWATRFFENPLTLECYDTEGNGGGELWYALRTYFAQYGIEASTDNIFNRQEDLDNIKNMLRDGKPVILGVPKGITIGAYRDNGRYDESINSHYVLIMGVYESEHNTYLEIYSHGKKQYLDWNEILAVNHGLFADLCISYLVVD